MLADSSDAHAGSWAARQYDRLPNAMQSESGFFGHVGCNEHFVEAPAQLLPGNWNHVIAKDLRQDFARRKND